ncbi:MAG: hypothetical protein FJY35_01490 [Betaproteobacteria bacterium]|nr:hypothetical protein [Betaproteobacteria bacterium]
MPMPHSPSRPPSQSPAPSSMQPANPPRDAASRPGASAADAPSGGLQAVAAESISAFIDNSLTEAQALRAAERLSRSEAYRAAALRYWLISDVLGSVGSSDHRPNLCAKIADRISKEPVFMPQPVRSAPARSSGRSLGPGLRLAASVAGLAFVGAGAFFLLSLPTAPDSETLLAGTGTPPAVGSVPALDPRVMRASFDSPQARALLDAHGASHVRLRMDDR